MTARMLAGSCGRGQGGSRCVGLGALTGCWLLCLTVIPDAGATMNLLIVACMLVEILKVPGLMRRYVTQTKPGITGQIFRLVVIQQITRGLSKGFSGGRTARAASTARPAAKVGWPTK
jgi:hypothetical protein